MTEFDITDLQYEGRRDGTDECANDGSYIAFTVVLDGSEPNIGSLPLKVNVDQAEAFALDILQAVRPGAHAIAEERRRQIEGEEWTEYHDDGHMDGELAAAAAAYATFASWPDQLRARCHSRIPMACYWPFEAAWWKPTTRQRDLEKAGALIAAEIERLDRMSCDDEEIHDD